MPSPETEHVDRLNEHREFLCRKTVHDFKNIFSILLANVELIEESCSGGENADRIKRIRLACEHGVGLLERVRCSCSESTDKEEECGTRNRGKVLLIEQDDALRGLWTRILEQEGYVISPCRTAKEAFTNFLEETDGYSLILMDLPPSDDDERQLIDQLWSIRPDVPCILVHETGGDGMIEQEAGKRIRFLEKPLTGSRLLAAVKSLLLRNE